MKNEHHRLFLSCNTAFSENALSDLSHMTLRTLSENTIFRTINSYEYWNPIENLDPTRLAVSENAIGNKCQKKMCVDLCSPTSLRVMNEHTIHTTQARK